MLVFATWPEPVAALLCSFFTPKSKMCGCASELPICHSSPSCKAEPLASLTSVSSASPVAPPAFCSCISPPSMSKMPDPISTALISTSIQSKSLVLSPSSSSEERKRVTLWHKVEKRSICGNAAPMAKNLSEYMAKHPDVEIYTGQDKVGAPIESPRPGRKRLDRGLTIPTCEQSPRAPTTPVAMAPTTPRVHPYYDKLSWARNLQEESKKKREVDEQHKMEEEQQRCKTQTASGIPVPQIRIVADYWTLPTEILKSMPEDGAEDTRDEFFAALHAPLADTERTIHQLAIQQAGGRRTRKNRSIHSHSEKSAAEDINRVDGFHALKDQIQVLDKENMKLRSQLFERDQQIAALVKALEEHRNHLASLLRSSDVAMSDVDGDVSETDGGSFQETAAGMVATPEEPLMEDILSSPGPCLKPSASRPVVCDGFTLKLSLKRAQPDTVDSAPHVVEPEGKRHKKRHHHKKEKESV
eukprot:GILJ01001706.1.p1 GENE.GILJ01001706.1~~GILJ01001706.1.p1  ORF type:complete len:471 (-),score=51.96 GILJ01001706.1:237-1649(-)